MYRVFRQLGNGEFLHVASPDELGEVVQLVKAFNANWPGGDYVVRDSEGNDVDRAALSSFMRFTEGDARRNASLAIGERGGNGLIVQSK
jgi:hypothetical protein